MMTPNEQISIFLEIIADYRNINADLRNENERLKNKDNETKACEYMPDYEYIIANLKEELNMVSNSNNKMLDELTIARNQNHCDEQDIMRLKHALDERMTECDKLKSDNLILEDQIKELENEVEEVIALRCEITKLKEHITKLNTENELLVEDLNRADYEIDNYRADYANIYDRWVEATKEIDKLKEELKTPDYYYDKDASATKITPVTGTAYTLTDAQKEVWEENPYFK